MPVRMLNIRQFLQLDTPYELQPTLPVVPDDGATRSDGLATEHRATTIQPRAHLI